MSIISADVFFCEYSYECNNPKQHTYPVYGLDVEFEELRSRISEEAVCKFASSLNSSQSCTIEYSPTRGSVLMIEGAHYHPRIRFHGGSPSWLLRVPHGTHPGALLSWLVEYAMVSEYATLRFLETITVPAPRAFTYGVCGSGTDYGIWSGSADILAELERHLFPKASSLCLESSGIDVTAVANDSFHALGPRGRLNTSTVYYTVRTGQHLELIAEHQIYLQYPIGLCLVYRFIGDYISQLVPQEGNETTEQFLKHVDDKGDHLLVDDQMNITGIIDWQMGRVVPRREAFGPSLVTADVRNWCPSSLSANDVVLVDILELVWGLECMPWWEQALSLANAILRAFGVDEDWSQLEEAALK
ncbi:hypothetical protein BJ878DRAFT_580844 [Calycina marina]|uniref:Aminoglycoside phosphotransferase domain-containing protein n=1 Tax=Calycina marina TaxID=1763456 RepID=A0A9P7Z7Y1_9HELO|nr:hypothetical protein BJ878DRAFT_580844 [Calycina marina]